MDVIKVYIHSDREYFDIKDEFEKKYTRYDYLIRLLYEHKLTDSVNHTCEYHAVVFIVVNMGQIDYTKFTVEDIFNIKMKWC